MDLLVWISRIDLALIFRMDLVWISLVWISRIGLSFEFLAWSAHWMSLIRISWTSHAKYQKRKLSFLPKKYRKGQFDFLLTLTYDRSSTPNFCSPPLERSTGPIAISFTICRHFPWALERALCWPNSRALRPMFPFKIVTVVRASSRP